MGKRTLLAIVLSVVVLSAYSVLVSRIYPVANKEDTSKNVPPSTPKELPAATPGAVPAQPLLLTPTGQFVEFETDKLKVTFVNPGAYISKVELKEHNTQFFLQNLLFVEGEQNYDFQVEKTAEVATFTFRDRGREIVKRYFFHNNSYYIELEHSARNLSAALPANYRLWLNTYLEKPSAQDRNFLELAVAPRNEAGQAQLKNIIRKNLLGVKTGLVYAGGIDWVGARDRYFALILRPENKTSGVSIQQAHLDDEAGQAGEQVQVGVEVIPQGTDKYTLYIGPQDVASLSAANMGFENMLYFGFFDTISQILLSVLKFLFGLTHNWGGAILLFGFLIFLAMYPLTLKQTRSMKEMQILQPKIKELQERHRGDSVKLNREIMDLYKAHKVNPLGGCLPMVLQIPIFFGLYQALMRFVGLRGQSFLWIKDLSQPDRLITLQTKIPIIGSDINLLPILMMVSMFFQQKASMSAMSGSSSAEQQKMMAIMMPLVMGMLFYSMPAALVLYWFVYGIMGAAQQWLLTRPQKIE